MDSLGVRHLRHDKATRVPRSVGSLHNQVTLPPARVGPSPLGISSEWRCDAADVSTVRIYAHPHLDETAKEDCVAWLVARAGIDERQLLDDSEFMQQRST